MQLVLRPANIQKAGDRQETKRDVHICERAVHICECGVRICRVLPENVLLRTVDRSRTSLNGSGGDGN